MSHSSLTCDFEELRSRSCDHFCFAVFPLQFSCKPPSLKSADLSVPVGILHFKGLLISSPPSLSLSVVEDWNPLGFSAGRCRGCEDASILSVRKQRHAGQQVRVGQSPALHQRQPHHIPVRTCTHWSCVTLTAAETVTPVSMATCFSQERQGRCSAVKCCSEDVRAPMSTCVCRHLHTLDVNNPAQIYTHAHPHMRNYILMYASTQTYARTRLCFLISVYVHMHTDILKLSINILFASGFSDSCETTARSPSFLAADRSCPTTSPKRSRESAISWRRGSPRATPLSPALAPPPYGKCPTTSAPCSYGRLASETASPIRRITAYCRLALPVATGCPASRTKLQPQR